MSNEEIVEVADKVAKEFGLQIRWNRGSAQFYKVDLDLITKSRFQVPESIPVYHVLGITRIGQTLDAVAEKNSQFKEETMGLPDFSEKLDSFLKKLGFENQEYVVKSQRGLAVSLSYGFWTKKQEAKELAPKLRVR